MVNENQGALGDASPRLVLRKGDLHVGDLPSSRSARYSSKETARLRRPRSNKRIFTVCNGREMQAKSRSVYRFETPSLLGNKTPAQSICKSRDPLVTQMPIFSSVKIDTKVYQSDSCGRLARCPKTADRVSPASDTKPYQSRFLGFWAPFCFCRRST